MNDKQLKAKNDQLKAKQAATENLTPKSLSTTLGDMGVAKAPPPKPVCQRCEKADRPLDHSGRYCEPCILMIKEEQRQKEDAETAEKQAKAIIPERYQGAKLSQIDPEIVAQYKSLARGQGLFLYGKQGVGKTYAMAAFLKDVIDGRRVCRRTSYEMLCLEIRDTFKPTATKTEHEVIKQYIEADYLFIEDVGTTTKYEETDFSRRTFLVILDQRLEQMKPTFITSNKTLVEFATSFDKRVASRMSEVCIICGMTGKDRRLEQ
jgi:DNA replication protein DnaC